MNLGNKIHRIMITGGRTCTDYNTISRQISIAISDIFDSTKLLPVRIDFLHGGAAGADTLGLEFVNKVQPSLRARGVDIQVDPHYPDIARYGRPAAYHIRNRAMVDKLAADDILLAFPKGESPGTLSVIKYARSKGIVPRIFREL